MPLPKPKKGESQSDYMGRCMHEAYGPDAPDDRAQDQAIAMCMQAWRDKDKKELVKKQDAPSPDAHEDEDDYLERCLEEMTEDNPDMTEGEITTECQAAWDDYQGPEDKAAHLKERAKPGITVFRTHAEKVDGMNFVLSDETP